MNLEQSLIIPAESQVSEALLVKARDFISIFNVYEINNEVSLLLNYDRKSDAYYLVCHLDGQTLEEKSDTDAVLDANDEEYRLNRDLSTDKYAYKLMMEDAIKGRGFEDIVLEYDLSYRSNKPLKVYGGQHRIAAISAALEKSVNTVHGCRIYFNLTRDQKVEIATVNNTSIAVPSDLLDRMQEDQLGSQLRNWCQEVGLLSEGENFADRGTSDVPSVRVARTLVTNFYIGKEETIENENSFYQPVLCSSGPGIDSNYEKIRQQIDWNDSHLREMGQHFAQLHKLQMQKINSRSKGKNAGSARKVLSLAVVASWAFASGLFQKKPDFLKKHYLLSSSISHSDDPLNSNALSQARLKGKDRENYRGLGTRNDANEPVCVKSGETTW